MKIIELTETQFKNYSTMHSSRNYFQTVEYANTRPSYQRLYLGFISEGNNTLMGAVLILENNVGKFKTGIVNGGFLIDYDNDNLFKDFITNLKNYLKSKKYVYVEVSNRTTYKIFDKQGKVLYYDTNIIKILDELSFVKTNKFINREVVIETEKTPNETYKMFNSNTKRNINLALQRAISIYKDENNNIDTLLNLTKDSNAEEIKTLLKNFNTKNNTAEIYFAKIDPEQWVNNYRFLLKEEEKNNDRLNSILQDPKTKKSNSLITKKMQSDKLIIKYNQEIIKATNIYTKYPDGAIIGAVLIIKNNREVYFLYEGYNKDLQDFYSSHLIKWEIIKKYLTLGYKIINFGNIKNMNKTNGDYLFKMGFGGKVYEYIGTYDLIVNKWLYRLIKLINKIKKMILSKKS